MDTSEPNTVLQRKGLEALGYVRDCSADVIRIAEIFCGTLDDDRNEVSLPPLHSIFSPEDAAEFVERLRRLGLHVCASYDATHIRWRSVSTFPDAQTVANLTVDSFKPLAEKCLREIRGLIERSVSRGEFDFIFKEMLTYPTQVQDEVITFLKNSGYSVGEYFIIKCEQGDDYEYLAGYLISWYPPKPISLPWWKRWRKHVHL